MARHNETGAWGEEMAREYLIGKGYTIVDTNHRVGHKELDIVATKGERIVFVEVKTRSSGIEDPTSAVDRKKIRRLCMAADSFLRTYNIRHVPQFDVITITGSREKGYELEHIPDAFMPPLT